jgi:hypothetical protein
MEEPKRCTYMAIAEGGKQLNIAKVVSIGGQWDSRAI